MFGEKNITYKNLNLKIHPKYHWIELLMDDQNFWDEKGFVTSISVILEFALFSRPDYIIVNRINFNGKVSPILFQFIKKHILHPLAAEGIRKLICLVDEQVFLDYYKDIETTEPFLKGFISREDAIRWITEDQKRHKYTQQKNSPE